MANRLRGSIYIIDSDSTALRDISSDGWPAAAHVQGIGFHMANSSADMILCFASDSNDTVIHLGYTVQGLISGTDKTTTEVNMAFQYIDLGGVRFQELRVRNLAAGTGYIYFK